MESRPVRQTACLGDGQSSFDPAYFAPLFAIEDRHFWFRARNQVIVTLVKQITASLESNYRVLEVGCGSGNVLRVLNQICLPHTVFGMDLFAEGLQYARQRVSCPLLQGDIQTPPFSTQFHVIGLFDVLEHLSDDRQILQQLRTMLRPGGALILTVPAHASLWSYFDEASHHCRRYELADLQQKLLGTGYRIEYLTQYMLSIFPLVWLGRRVAALLKRPPAGEAAPVHELATQELGIIPVVNTLLTWLLSKEASLIARRWRLPIGTSIVAIARKDSAPD